MQIWVDANACPGEIKALLDRAAERLKVKLTLVAGGGDHIGAALPALVPKTDRLSPINSTLASQKSVCKGLIRSINC